MDIPKYHSYNIAPRYNSKELFFQVLLTMDRDISYNKNRQDALDTFDLFQ